VNQLATDKAPDVRLPLRHLLAGAAVLCLAASLLVVAGPSAVLRPVDSPRALAVTHLVTLGWVTLTMMGASYQLVPVVLQSRLWSERLGHLAFWHFLPGVVLLATGFWIFRPPVIVLGGTLAVAGVGLYVYNMARTLRRTPTWGLQGAFLATALAYLLTVAGLGLTLAANFVWGFLGPWTADHLAFHVLVGLFGWVTVLAMGVAYKLAPMFALAPEEGNGRWVLAMTGGGLAVLVGALAVRAGPLGRSLAALPPLAGVALFLRDQWRIFRARRRPRLDVGLRLTAVAFAYLGLAAALGWAAAAGWLRLPVAALVDLGLFGWAGCLIAGQLYKIVPFLVWYHRYSDRAGRDPVPLLRDMYSARWAEVDFWALVPAGALLAAGTATGIPAVALLGSLALLGGGAVLLGNLWRVTRA
jgi:hypothetical protein